jgi:hypothetical protein
VKRILVKMLCFFCIAILMFTQSGCAEMEMDLTVNRDGSGKASIGLTSLDTYLNSEFTNAIQKLRKQLKDEGIQAKITESTKNNLKHAKIELSSKNISRDSKKISDLVGISIQHELNGKTHRVTVKDNEGMLTKLSIKMPGKITDSNGNASGSSVRWDIDPYEFTMGEKSWWAESGSSGAGSASSSAGSGSPFLVLGIIAFILGIVVFFLKKNKPSIEAYETSAQAQGGFCMECGNPMNPSEQFCSECGARRE